MPEALRLPPAAAMQWHVFAALRRYWPAAQFDQLNMPIRARSVADVAIPLRLKSVRLPEWAAACGIDGCILVPGETSDAVGNWQEVDWWQAAFLMLEGWHERAWEARHGPIHSYSFRLQGWDERAWQHAWVNRIGLFLRAWAAKLKDLPEARMFGALPEPEILLTHDVDAVEKTTPIRIKQGIFNLFNALRALARRDANDAKRKAKQALRFACGSGDWWTLDTLLDIEQKLNLRVRYHFYADIRPRTPRQWLFDPGYSIEAPKIRAFLDRLKKSGAEIGIHPSFDSWSKAQPIKRQIDRLASIGGCTVVYARQHWLRFSWQATWAAQQTAGIAQDSTLMFNDRAGFRNAAAIEWSPWNQLSGWPHDLSALPTVLMDSHFYDYKPMSPESRRRAMTHWVEECRAVHGQVAVLWHPHTLTMDYGWGPGLDQLIDLIAAR
jgi:hypothetical protein